MLIMQNVALDVGVINHFRTTMEFQWNKINNNNNTMVKEQENPKPTKSANTNQRVIHYFLLPKACNFLMFNNNL